MELRGNISTRLRQCTAYADDILITARTQAMIDTFVKLKNESLKYGLTVNVHKTKYLKYSRRQDQLKAINIETRMVKAIHAWKPISKRPMGRPKIRWEDDVKKRYTEVKSAKLENSCPG